MGPSCRSGSAHSSQTIFASLQTPTGPSVTSPFRSPAGATPILLTRHRNQLLPMPAPFDVASHLEERSAHRWREAVMGARRRPHEGPSRAGADEGAYNPGALNYGHRFRGARPSGDINIGMPSPSRSLHTVSASRTKEGWVSSIS